MLLKNRKPSENGGIGSRIFDFCNILFMLCLAFITLYPMYNIFIVSISSAEYIYAGAVSFIPKGINFDAYRMVFKNDSIWRSFGNSILYTTVGTAINVVCSAMCAYPLSRKDFYGRGFFTLFVAVTMFISGGMIPSYLVVNQLRLINTMWAIVLPGAISTYNMIIMRTFFQNLPVSLQESAYLDGANDITILFKVVLPLSMPIIATMTLFYAVGHWNSYFNAMIYLNSKSKFPLQVLLREIVVAGNMADESSDLTSNINIIAINFKYAVIVITVVPILVVYPFLQKHFTKGVMIGAIKG
ncbi:MAG: carbohydrate ABC transporter permease [Oscillospiraceae bacterium]|jgi:putative aldouronate transport system permease protein|nr:carbohydrate ABC transporter permease [Oscillospiraceae bacterium]